MDRSKHAREYFDAMPDKDVPAWNAMIEEGNLYADQGLLVEANMLSRSAPKKETATWNAHLEFAAHLVFMLRQAHAFAMKLGFERYTALSNMLICAYSRSGDISSAHTIFKSLEMKDNISWTTFMLVCSRHGQGKPALEALGQMLRSGARPYEITFVVLLSACGHEGLIRKDQKLFKWLSRAYNLVPKAEHYASVIDILGRAGKLKEAKEVITKMPPSKDTAVLGALLSASSACMRKMMKERKIKKIPGHSQIEIKGIEQLFLSGDRSHPEINYVCKCLSDELRCSISVHEDN
ncbi:hypothetical protein Droror1_Dr00006525 [Drosera rotundifolia]